MCVCIYIYIHIYTHTPTHTHTDSVHIAWGVAYDLMCWFLFGLGFVALILQWVYGFAAGTLNLKP